MADPTRTTDGAARFDLPAPPRTSRFAVASFCFAILNLCALPVIGGLIAIYCGVMGLRAMRNEPELMGRGLAKAGIVMGAVGTLLMLLVSVDVVRALVQLNRELEQVERLVSEFREAYAKGDADAIHSKLTARGREKLALKELKVKIEEWRRRFGTFSEADLVKDSIRKLDEKEILTRFGFDLTGPLGKFRGTFDCRKEGGIWHLESFDLTDR
jgi:hypothetical protein